MRIDGTIAIRRQLDLAVIWVSLRKLIYNRTKSNHFLKRAKMNTRTYKFNLVSQLTIVIMNFYTFECETFQCPFLNLYLLSLPINVI